MEVKHNFVYYDTKVSIIIPVFNEEENIRSNIQLLLDQVKGHFKDFELIIVSDGSTDNTLKELKTLTDRSIQVIALAKNLGKGAAIRRGFAKATGEYLFFIDGGMEIHPKELSIFLGLMLLYNADIVMGSKRHPQSLVRYPIYRRFLSWIYQNMIRLVFKINVTDSQVGMKLFKKNVVMSILPFLEIDRYGFDLELLIFAKMVGYHNFLEAPVRLDYFLKNKKNIAKDLFHVLRVGRLLLFDTIKLYRKVQKIKNEKKLQANSPEKIETSVSDLQRRI